MDDLPAVMDLSESRVIVRTWGDILSPLDHLAAELVAVCITNLSRRRQDRWSERELLTETTLARHRFDRDLLQNSPLVERYFDAALADRQAVLATAQYLVIYRPSAEPN